MLGLKLLIVLPDALTIGSGHLPSEAKASKVYLVNLVLISKRIEFSRPENPKIHKFFFGLDHFR